MCERLREKFFELRLRRVAKLTKKANKLMNKEIARIEKDINLIDLLEQMKKRAD